MAVRHEPGLVPFTAAELPQYLNSELRAIAAALNDLQTQINDLEARVTALETP